MDVIEKLGALKAEAEEHVTRLGAKAKTLLQRLKNGEAIPNDELVKLVAESFSEQVNTGLDFMLSMIAVVGEGFAEVGPGGEGEETVGIEPEDATRIIGVIDDAISMLEKTLELSQLSPEEKKVLEDKLTNAREVRVLVEELELDPPEEGEGDEDEGDDEEDES